MPSSNFTEFEKYAPQTLKYLFLSNERSRRCRPPQAAPTLPTFVRLNFHPAEVQATPSNYFNMFDFVSILGGRWHEALAFKLGFDGTWNGD